jgi:hypothetical protein
MTSTPLVNAFAPTSAAVADSKLFFVAVSSSPETAPELPSFARRS